jgi:hypothetical protein
LFVSSAVDGEIGMERRAQGQPAVAHVGEDVKAVEGGMVLKPHVDLDVRRDAAGVGKAASSRFGGRVLDQPDDRGF